MEIYYVKENTQLSGVYEVHTSDCALLKDFINRVCLGTFFTYSDALKEAEKYFANVESCKLCAQERILIRPNP
jgi:hypothetical protein